MPKRVLSHFLMAMSHSFLERNCSLPLYIQIPLCMEIVSDMSIFCILVSSFLNCLSFEKRTASLERTVYDVLIVQQYSCRPLTKKPFKKGQSNISLAIANNLYTSEMRTTGISKWTTGPNLSLIQCICIFTVGILQAASEIRGIEAETWGGSGFSWQLDRAWCWWW